MKKIFIDYYLNGMSNKKKYTIRVIVLILVFVVYAFWRKIDYELGNGALSAFIRVFVLYLVLHLTWIKTKKTNLENGNKNYKGIEIYIIVIVVLCLWWFLPHQNKSISYKESNKISSYSYNKTESLPSNINYSHSKKSSGLKNKTIENKAPKQPLVIQNEVKHSPSFGIGSLMKEVIKVQGKPTFTRLNNSSIILNYGLSSVKISSNTKKVYAWYNLDNNLKTFLNQKGNNTSSESITVGSHVDDVIRLYGQPNYVELNWPDLAYGYGNNCIYISIENHTVTKWTNNEK